MGMLDPQKITLARIKTAYELTVQEAESLLNALFPGAIFPYETWRRAYKKWGLDSVLEAGPARQLGSPPYFPANICPTRVYAIQLVASLIDPARLHRVSALEEGFEQVIEATYEEGAFPFHEEKENLFRLMHQEFQTYHQQNKDSEAVWRIFHHFPVEYNFIHEMFPDTIVVDKAAAIRHLDTCGFPLRHEAKGITRALAKSILAAPASPEQPAQADTPAAAPVSTLEAPQAEPSPQAERSAIQIPTALWEGKSAAAVRDAMKEEYGKPVIAYVLRNWCKINKTETGRLLSEKQYEDEKSYRNFVNDLMKEAALLAIFKD